MDKTKMTEQWEELSRRLEHEAGLCKVLEGLSNAIGTTDVGEADARSRLRVPYASAANPSNNGRWM